MRDKMKLYRTETIAFWAVMIIAAVGIYFRLKGLGKWSFTNDEYYLAQSVRHILERGLPEFKCGGYYTRGLLYQYVMTPFIAMGFSPEWSFRLVPFFAHVIALPGLYKLSTKVSGKFVALIIVAVYSVSTLEIEISRFARMYLPFQALFIWYLYFLHRAIVDKDSRAYPWMLILSFVGLLTFEGGIFLTLLNFLPFLKAEKIRLKYLIFCMIIFLFGYFYLTIDFRNLSQGLANNWPPDLPMLPTGGGGKIYKPYLFVAGLLKKPVWMLLFVPPVLFSGWGAFQILRNSGFNLITRLSLILCLLFSLSNLFMMIGMVIIILMLFDLVEPKQLKSDLLKTLVIPILVNLIFWIIYGLANSGEYGPLAVLSSGGHVERLIEKLFNKIPGELQIISNSLNLLLVLFYPLIGLLGIFYKWLMVYPLILLALGAFLVFNSYFLIPKGDGRYAGHRFLFAVFILNVMMVGSLNIGTGTRYTFFIYPVFLLLALVGIKQLSEKFLGSGLTSKIATLGVFMSIFVVSNDFSLKHLLHIDSAKINFRQVYNPYLTTHFIMRRDYKGVAEFIKAHTKEGDLVISGHQTLHYYTKRVDYILFGNKNAQFPAYTACRGKKDRWTNTALIYKTDQLLDLIEHSKTTVWIVVNIAEPRYDEAKAIQRYRDKLFFTAQDGILGVFKLDKDA
jgi:hypothetical protein